MNLIKLPRAVTRNEDVSELNTSDNPQSQPESTLTNEEQYSTVYYNTDTEEIDLRPVNTNMPASEKIVPASTSAFLTTKTWNFDTPWIYTVTNRNFVQQLPTQLPPTTSISNWSSVIFNPENYCYTIGDGNYTPILFTKFDDPLGIGELAAKPTSLHVITIRYSENGDVWYQFENDMWSFELGHTLGYNHRKEQNGHKRNR